MHSSLSFPHGFGTHPDPFSIKADPAEDIFPFIWLMQIIATTGQVQIVAAMQLMLGSYRYIVQFNMQRNYNHKKVLRLIHEWRSLKQVNA